MEKHIILISKLPTDSASKICTQSLFFSLGKNSETSPYDKTRRRDETCCPRTLDICNMSLEEPHLQGSFILRSKGINLDKCQRWQSNFSQRFYRCLCTHTHTHTHVHTHTHTQANQEKQSCLEVQPSYSHPPKANSLIRESIFYFIMLEFVASYSRASDPA